MQSKEKIEKAKEDFSFFYEGDYITKEMVNSKETIFEYIKQLETDKQKLIEKLEEKHTEAKTKYSETLSPYQYGRLDVVEELLEILKGENK